ncbi:tripartite tricarboxylate transporter TctB family protein [Billgrantia sp. LNSP4103-1]|uniref:tripartite tricarboxylate transporter TctB family protein n=1 Tax=Billgrantia sp. LNSP4103-1 TaxID=3410266 RepID=UPI00403F0FF2
MRIWFSLSLLFFSILFLAYGLNTLSLFTSTGRPGPGFFPAIVGIGLVTFTAINTYKDFRERQSAARETHHSLLEKQASSIKSEEDEVKDADTKADEAGTTYARDVVWALAFIALFIALLRPLGAVLSMVVFMFILLWKFNPGKTRFNAIYSVLFPLGTYLLFEVWLRAGLPDGIFPY